MNPQLATDWKETKLKFPLIGQPKIDGVRGLNLSTVNAGAGMTARSLRPFDNVHTTNFFSQQIYKGFDGELAAEKETHPNLCSLTSSATRTIEGTPWLMWHVFDYITPQTISLPYYRRLEILGEMVFEANERFSELGQHLRRIEYKKLYDMAQLLAYEDKLLSLGYEGLILRNPDATYKEGRSTQKAELWRVKRFVDFEFVVTEVTEAVENQNEATVNLLGNTARSGHQGNLVPKGMIGNIIGHVLKDVVHEGKVLFPKGFKVTVGPGKMTHEQRIWYFLNQNLIVGEVGKAKFFPKGIKDKPRFPTWIAFRDTKDL